MSMAIFLASTLGFAQIKGNKKIESIPYNAGLNTPSAFYSAFKKTTGINPTEYQKKYLVKPEG